MRLSKSDMRYFGLSHKEALKSDFSPFKLGCVIVYKGHILSTGHNSYKTSPVQMHYNRYRHFNGNADDAMHTIHAEIDALSHISYEVSRTTDWSKVRVYVYRISHGHKSGRGLARPCSGCIEALRQRGVRDIYYTGNDSYIYERL